MLFLYGVEGLKEKGEGINAFLIDMDGTICKGWQVIPGAIEFIQYLKDEKKPFVLLTNNSSASRKSYLYKMRTLGFDVDLEDILTSTTATILYLQAEHPKKSVYPLGTPDFCNEVRDAGILIASHDPDIVLLAFDRTITYEKINKAYHYLLNGAEFVCTHPDELCPTENGYDVDIGPFINILSSLTGVQPVIVGKPNVKMAEMASRHMGVPLHSMAMIGDRLYTDMKMAWENGFTSILVLSGETVVADLMESKIEPDIVAASIADFIDFF